MPSVIIPSDAGGVSAALVARGGTTLSSGIYLLDESIVVPSGCTLEGVGYGTHLKVAGDFPAVVFLDEDGTRCERASVRNLRISHTNTLGAEAGDYQTESDGIRLWGDDLTVEDVWIEDCYVAVRLDIQPQALTSTPTSRAADQLTDTTLSMTTDQYVGYQLRDGDGTLFEITANTATVFALDAGGATPAAGTYAVFEDPLEPSTEIALTRVRASHSAPTIEGSLWGIQLANVNRLIARDCRSSSAWLDGLKVLRDVADFTIDGGYYNDNTNTGIDCYAGAGRGRLIGVTANGNGDVGCVIKTSSLSPSYGRIRDLEVAHCTMSENATGGLVIGRDAGQETKPQVANVTIIGGRYDDNSTGVGTGAGVSADARGVDLVGVKASGNEGPGLWIRTTARDVRVAGGLYAVNGSGLGAGASNIIVDGKRVHIDHPILLGKDGDAADDDAWDALDVVSQNGILVQSTADDVTLRLRESDGRGHGTALVATAGSPGMVCHFEAEGDPQSTAIWPGGVGSTLSRTDGGEGTSLYVKEEGPSNARVGWSAVS